MWSGRVGNVWWLGIWCRFFLWIGNIIDCVGIVGWMGKKLVIY